MSAMTSEKGPKVMIGLNTTWNLVNFRAGLISALQRRGYRVVACAPPDRYVSRLLQLGCRFVPIAMQGQGTNPLREAMLFARYLHVLREERPDAFLAFTVKPNIYGSLAARTLGIPVVNNITGLGTAFIRTGWLTRVVRTLYRTALARSSRVFFQNDDDRDLFVRSRLVAAERTDRVPGSGINLTRFAPPPVRDSSLVPFRFLLIARLLKDKGVREYAEAAAIVRHRYPRVQCCLLGGVDPQNPAAITREELSAWTASGAIDYRGETDDVAAEIARADCVVLPSYREGLPRTLLEAAAMARPMIATDVEGCRDVVTDGANGFLCNVRDAADLAAKMLRMVQLAPEDRLAMGRRARVDVEQEFDERIVINKYLAAIEAVLAGTHAPEAARPVNAPGS